MSVNEDAALRRQEGREQAVKKHKEHIRHRDAWVLRQVCNNPADFFKDKYAEIAELGPLAAPAFVAAHPLAATSPSAAVPLETLTVLVNVAAKAPITPAPALPEVDFVAAICGRDSQRPAVWRMAGVTAPVEQINDRVTRIADPEVTPNQGSTASLSADPFDDVPRAVKRNERVRPARYKRPAKVARPPARIDLGKAVAMANSKKKPVPAAQAAPGLQPVAAPVVLVATSKPVQAHRVTKVAPGMPFYDGDDEQKAPRMVITPADSNLPYPLVVAVDPVTIGQVLAIYGRDAKQYGLSEDDLRLPMTNWTAEEMLAYAARLTEHINRDRPADKQIEPYRPLKNDEWAAVCLAGVPRGEARHGDGAAAFSQAVCQWSAAKNPRQRRPFHENPTRPANVDSPCNEVNRYQLRGMYGNVIEITISLLDGSVMWSGGGFADRPELLAATCCREPESAKAPWLGLRLSRDVSDHEYHPHEQDE